MGRGSSKRRRRILEDRMIILTAKVPSSYVVAIDRLVSLGLYSNRSEAVREAIRELLRKHVQHQSKGLEDLLAPGRKRVKVEEIKVGEGTEEAEEEAEDIEVELVKKDD